MGRANRPPRPGGGRADWLCCCDTKNKKSGSSYHGGGERKARLFVERLRSLCRLLRSLPPSHRHLPRCARSRIQKKAITTVFSRIRSLYLPCEFVHSVPRSLPQDCADFWLRNRDCLLAELRRLMRQFSMISLGSHGPLSSRPCCNQHVSPVSC
jgi:hypothetical protein